VPLFPTMLIVPPPSTSPSRITSSPSYSPEHSPSPTPEPTPNHTTAAATQPSPTQPSPGTEHHLPTPNDSPLHADDLRKTKKTYSSAFTKLILRVKKLEVRVKIRKSRKRARVVLSEDDEDIADDSSKQGRKLSDVEVQEKASNETEPVIQDVTPTEVIQDQESSEKGSAKVSTAGANTASEEVPIVSTTEVNPSTAGGTVTYTRKDKGKAIMTEPEPKNKSNK
ncbi:hypothetical protein Tco_0057184, partial [Tanacetum coccineum]